MHILDQACCEHEITFNNFEDLSVKDKTDQHLEFKEFDRFIS